MADQQGKSSSHFDDLFSTFKKWEAKILSLKESSAEYPGGHCSLVLELEQTPIVPSAIANAFYAAQGKRLRHMPFIPYRITEALEI